jgi:ABC-type amino acid transport substrate-binding protein
MKKNKKFMLMLLVLLVGILAACGAADNEEAGNNDSEKVLVMGTSADYPPFEYVETATGEEIIGFDVDLAKAIGEKLGYEVEVKDMDFGGLIPALENGTVDFVLAGMSPTPERAKTVDFTDIYYTAKHTLLTMKDSGVTSTADLNGKTVGVQLASIQEGVATDIQKSEGLDMTIEKRNRVPELVQELKAGRFDAVIIEDTVAKGYLADNPDLQATVIETGGEDAGSAIAFPKDSELTAQFNEKLAEMKENGELEELVVIWFGDTETK